MTRLRFLIVSAFAAVAASFGFDRERLARRWLERNGFVITEYQTHRIGAPELGCFRVIINHSKLGLCGARACSSGVPILTPASSYLDWLAQNDFMIQDRHLVLNFSQVEDWDSAESTPMYREIAPPTIHRFERPWWA